MELLTAVAENSVMAKLRGPYEKRAAVDVPRWRLTKLAAWRRYRKMTQEQLAADAGFNSSGPISDMEKGLVGYSPESLDALARALRISRGMLLDVDPFDAEAMNRVQEEFRVATAPKAAERSERAKRRS